MGSNKYFARFGSSNSKLVPSSMLLLFMFGIKFCCACIYFEICRTKTLPAILAQADGLGGHPRGHLFCPTLRALLTCDRGGDSVGIAYPMECRSARPGGNLPFRDWDVAARAFVARSAPSRGASLHCVEAGWRLNQGNLGYT